MPTTAIDVLVYVLKFIVVTFAVYRLAFEIAARMGPFDLFYKWRSKLSMMAAKPGWLWLEEWVTCAACQSLWIAFVATLVFFRGLPIDWFFITWFGISGLTTVIHFQLIGLKG